MDLLKHRYVLIRFLSPKRQVFAQFTPNESLPTPEPYADIETLEEAYNLLKTALAESDNRLRAIKQYYGSDASKMPAGMRQSYDSYLQTRNNILNELKAIENQMRANRIALDSSSNDAQQKTIIANTLQALDETFAALAEQQRSSEKELPGDPMRGFPMFLFDRTDNPHVDAAARQKAKNKKSKSTAKVTEAGETKSTITKESQEYWTALYRNVTSKIINYARTQTPARLTTEEKTAVMFMKGGDTMIINLDGQKYLLERDLTGKYLRLRDYWKEHGENATEKSKEDPSIAINRGSSGIPLWATLTAADLEARRQKSAQEKASRDAKNQEKQRAMVTDDLRKRLEWLFAPGTSAGSRVSFRHIVSKEQIANTDKEKRIVMRVELLRKYDGSVQARYLKQSLVINMNGISEQTETIQDKTVLFPANAMENCQNNVQAYLQSDSLITASEASPQDYEEERRTFIEQRLDLMSGNLARASILPGQEKLISDDTTGNDRVAMVNTEFVRWLREIQNLIDAEKITDWEQPLNSPNAFLDMHILIRGGKISVLKENPAFKQYQDGIRNGVTPKEAPPQYLAIYHDIRLKQNSSADSQSA